MNINSNSFITKQAFHKYIEDNKGDKKLLLDLGQISKDISLGEIESFIKIFDNTGMFTITSQKEDPTIENKQLEDLISQIRDSFDGSIEVYTKGSCIKFCMILQTVFPNGVILYNSDHAIFELNGRFYDITGEVDKLPSHIPIEQYGLLKCYELMSLKYSI